MNTSQLKSYAPAARRTFIEAVSAQAARVGITTAGTATAQIQGDVLLIDGQAHPMVIVEPRNRLAERVRAHGFEQTMEAIAYTWFNRFVAIRYMELHSYLDHGYRVISHPEAQGRPEILDHAADIELPGLDRQQAIELKLDGTQDEALYRLLLLAQCNALHQAMPFLFERIGDETELLLPANLLHSDSLIRQLVGSLDESLWQEIEIIGWLYQFYISEKKDQVIGKVVKSEDIPAATQLFTPNWIVKYMVQNSLGAQWLATYPQSPLKAQMEYYIEPAEQTDEVNAQLAAITPATLDPEALTLIDPASGSGHILVEAYALFKAIYLERGYRQRDVPQLILEKNLYGLDIDERAAQLTGFALMMKGRADDRRLFEPSRRSAVKLNVMALVDSAGFDAEGLAKGVELSDYGLKPGDLTELKRLFEHATTFGSLIQVPEGLAAKLPALNQLSEATNQDLFVSEALKRLGPLVKQAELLGAQYDAVVANPPYMGSKAMNGQLKKLAKDHFSNAKSDLFACFMERALSLGARHSRYSLITMPSWLFLSSFGKLREKLLSVSTISSLLHMGRGIFGIDFGSVAFVVQKTTIPKAMGRYFRLHKRNFQHIHIPDIAQLFQNALQYNAYKYDFDQYRGPEMGTQIPSESMSDGDQIQYLVRQSEFKMIPGSPLAYWVSEKIRNLYSNYGLLRDFAEPKQGMATTDNNKYLRQWWEVCLSKVGFNFSSLETAIQAEFKWFPYNKGGSFRKWSGNREYVVNWENDGEEIKKDVVRKYPYLNGNVGFVLKLTNPYFEQCLTWSATSSSHFGVRYSTHGFMFDVKGSSCFCDAKLLLPLLGFLASNITSQLLQALNPTIEFQNGNLKNLPIAQSFSHPSFLAESSTLVQSLTEFSNRDWNTYENSWDFQSLSVLTTSSEPTPTLESSYTAWITENRDTIAEMKRLEEENNRLFIDAYGLQDKLTPDVPIEQITLTVNPAYRYTGRGGKLTEEEQWTRFRQDTMEELVSYAIGCMMGRYSLDAPGLIYAHSGNQGFDPSRYATFPADDDGIIPVTDTDWFPDDAAHRLIDFLSVAWDESHLEANLTFLAENLSPRKGESSRETIRRYLHLAFFKKHLRTYKKRPIYWLFSSGRLRAFQCLVYLHRYNEGTLSRVRSEYVIPLQGKMAARLEKLQGDIEAATSTAHRRRIEKEHAKLEKQQVELLAFDEKLRHYADRRISLDLDDGVKVNYGKFGDLLAEVKAIHGKVPEAA